MTWVDIAIVGIILISGLISLWRGLVRELLSLLAWITATWLALTYNQEIARFFVPYIETPSIRLAAAFVVIFLASLLGISVINFLIVKLVTSTGLSGTDRMLGIFFGIARGIAIVTILVLLAGLTPVPEDPWWRESRMLGHFQNAALWLRNFLPEDMAGHFSFPENAATAPP